MHCVALKQTTHVLQSFFEIEKEREEVGLYAARHLFIQIVKFSMP